MIITGLLSVILTLAKALFSFINLPSMPDSVVSTFDNALNYIASGAGFVKIFLNMDVFNACMTIFLALLAFKYAYKFIMWVIGVIGRIKSGAEL